MVKTISEPVKRKSNDCYVDFRMFRFPSSEFELPEKQEQWTWWKNKEQTQPPFLARFNTLHDIIESTFEEDFGATQTAGQVAKALAGSSPISECGINPNGHSCRTSRAQTPRMPPSAFATPHFRTVPNGNLALNAGETPSRRLSSSEHSFNAQSPPITPIQTSSTSRPSNSSVQETLEITSNHEPESHVSLISRSSNSTVPQQTQETTPQPETANQELDLNTATSQPNIEAVNNFNAADSPNPGTEFQRHVEDFLPTTYLAPTINGGPRFPQACVLHSSSCNLWYSKSKLLRHLASCMLEYRKQNWFVDFAAVYNLFVPMIRRSILTKTNVIDLLSGKNWDAQIPQELLSLQ